jgi:WD40 repeat protein
MILGHSAASSDALVITGHTRRVQCVAYSTSGDLLASAAYGGEIIVWDAQTCAKLMLYQLEGAPGECFGIRFFPGNKIIISLWGDGLLYRVHREKKGSVWFPELLDSASGLRCIAWAPDWSDLLCGTSNGHIARFSCETGRTKGESLKAHSGSISSLNFTSDGLTVASTSIDRTFKIWSIDSGRFTGPSITWHGPSAIHGGGFSPTNPSLFAFVNGTNLQIYNVVTGTIDFHCEVLGARAISYSPNGEYIAARGLSEQHTYILKRLRWDENEASVPIKLEPSHTDYVACLLFSPDNKYLVSGSWDSTLHINILSQVGPRTTQEGHHSRIISIAFTFNGKQLASVAEDGSLCIWDLEDQRLIAGPHQIGTHSLGAMALSSNHMTVACGSTTEDAEFWSMGPDTEVAVRSPLHLAERLYICGMAFSPDDSNLAITFQANSGLEGQLCIKRVEEIRGASAVMIPLHFNPHKQRLAYHPNGGHICCGDQAWDLGKTPPAILSGDKLKITLDETLPVVIRFDDRASPLPAISLGFPIRQLLHIPPDLHVCISVAHGGFIALGSKNGRVTVIDFTRLVSQQESALLSKIGRPSNSFSEQC